MKKSRKNTKSNNESMREKGMNIEIAEDTDTIEEAVRVEVDTGNNEESAEIKVEIECVEGEGTEDKSGNADTEIDTADAIIGENSLEADGTKGKEENTEESTKRQRRKSGESSIYPIYKEKDGAKIVYRYGFCMVLNNATKEQKKKYGNKLRYLEVHKSYESAVEGLGKAVERKDEILEKKLEKLGEIDIVKA